MELSALPLFLGAGLALGLEEDLLPFSLSYLAGALFFSPDLDLWDSKATRRWGPLRFLWAPYARIFRHRGLSHSPLLGPLTRILYLLIWVALVALLFGWRPPPMEKVPWDKAGAVLLGLFLPQFFHVLLDRLAKPRL